MQTKLLGIRKERDETQEEVAKMLGLSTASYRSKELGHSQFKMNEMFALASHYHMTIDDIFLPTKSTKREQKISQETNSNE